MSVSQAFTTPDLAHPPYFPWEWYELVAGFMMGAYTRVIDTVQFDCQAQAVNAADKFYLASKVFNIPLKYSKWPANAVYYLDAVNAAYAVQKAWKQCSDLSPWWEFTNMPPPIEIEEYGPGKGRPGDDDEEEVVEEEVVEEEPEVVEEEEPEEEFNPWRLNKTSKRLREAPEGHDQDVDGFAREFGRDDDDTFIPRFDFKNLGPVWDKYFIFKAFDPEFPNGDGFIKYTYDQIMDKIEAVESGKRNYYETQEDWANILKKEQEYERDHYSLDQVWDAIWDAGFSTLHVMYNY